MTAKELFIMQKTDEILELVANAEDICQSDIQGIAMAIVMRCTDYKEATP